jgi:hypothetical protein
MVSELLGAGTSEALIRWDASDGDYLSGYDVIFSDSIISDFTGITPSVSNVQGDSIVMSGLNPETTYYVYVRAICKAQGHDEGTSDWKGISFTVIANHPSKVDTLEGVLVRGRSPLPEEAAYPIGTVMELTSTGWAKYVPTTYPSADEVYY